MLYIILFFAFIIRYFPRIVLPYAIADDGYNYFGDADLMRNSPYHMPKFYHRTLFKSPYGYSHYYPLLLSLFSRKNEIKVEALISPVFDTLLIYTGTLMFQQVLADLNIIYTQELVWLFALLLAVLPAYLKNDTGPRAYNGSARVMGQFFFLLIIYSYYHYVKTENLWYYLIAASIGAFLYPLSAFASQVFVFSGLFIGIFYSPAYFGVIALSFVILYVFSFGRAIKMFSPRFMHYEWYFKFYQKVTLQKWGYFSNPVKDYFKKLVFWTKLFITLKWRSLIIYINIEYNPIHLLVSSYFYYVFAFFFLGTHDTLSLLSWTCISLFIVFALTMLKPFLFLGESYRYLEFGVIPGLILFFISVNHLNHFHLIVLIWIFISIIRYVFFQVEFFRKYKTENYNYFIYKEFFSKINTLIDGNVYASGFFRTKATYFGNFNYLGNRGYMALKYLSLEDNYLAFGNYPFPSGDFNALIKRFDLKYWLTTKTDLENYLKYTNNYGDFMSRLELIENDERINTFLYRINKEKVLNVN